MSQSVIKNVLADMFVFKEFNQTYSLGAYVSTEYTLNIAIANYKPFAIRAVSSGNQYISIHSANIGSTNKFYLDLKNRENSTQTGTATVRIAYVKAPVTEIT